MASQKLKYCKSFERNSHWRKLSMIMVWECYCYASPKPELFLIFFVYIFIHISANMSPFGLKFSQMILHSETSKLMYNWSFLFVVLHKPTLLPSTFKLVMLHEWKFFFSSARTEPYTAKLVVNVDLFFGWGWGRGVACQPTCLPSAPSGFWSLRHWKQYFEHQRATNRVAWHFLESASK